MTLKSLACTISTVLLAGCGSTVATQTYNADLIITNGQVLTINSEMDVIEDGVVVVKDDQIIAVGNEDLITQYRAEKVIDAPVRAE